MVQHGWRAPPGDSAGFTAPADEMRGELGPVNSLCPSRTLPYHSYSDNERASVEILFTEHRTSQVLHLLAADAARERRGHGAHVDA